MVTKYQFIEATVLRLIVNQDSIPRQIVEAGPATMGSTNSVPTLASI